MPPKRKKKQPVESTGDQGTTEVPPAPKKQKKAAPRAATQKKAAPRAATKKNTKKLTLKLPTTLEIATDQPSEGLSLPHMALDTDQMLGVDGIDISTDPNVLTLPDDNESTVQTTSKVPARSEVDLPPVDAIMEDFDFDESLSEFGEDSAISKPPRKKARQPGAGSQSTQSDNAEVEDVQVMLDIPRVAGNGTQRKSIKSTMPFNEVIGIIHETIGCTTVKVKPNLCYKLGSAPQKSNSISLSTSDDWNGLLLELLPAQKKKKVTIPVSILLEES
ncbi:hypothetical protein BDN72DRAFT_920417, partial [Pluteus cervinus]